jgi:hypothetical protein
MPVVRKTLIAVSVLLLGAGIVACGGSDSPAASLNHCPKHPPGLAGGSAGTEGETVETQPKSALICRWRGSIYNRRIERDEMTIGPGLAGLVATLNSLPPPQEGEFACESNRPLRYLVILHYRESVDAELEADFETCPYALTEDHSWGTGRLEHRLDALLDK